MANLENCLIFMSHSKFNKNPYYLYKYNIRGLICAEHSYYSDKYFEARYRLPDDVINYMVSNPNPNLILFEALFGDYTDLRTVDKMMNFVKSILEIIAVNTNIEHLILNVGEIYNPHSFRDEEDYIDIFIDNLLPNSLKKILGDDRYKNIKSIKYVGLRNIIIKVFNKSYRQNDFISALDGYDKEFIQISDSLRGFSYEIKESILEKIYESIKNTKYYGDYDYTYNSGYISDIVGYDYYKYKKNEDTKGFENSDFAMKSFFTSELKKDKNYVPFKHCGFEQYLYYHYRGNLINGHMFKKFEYPRPDDVWEGDLPVGEYDENN